MQNVRTKRNSKEVQAAIGSTIKYMQRGLLQRHSRNPQFTRPVQHNKAVAVAVTTADAGSRLGVTSGPSRDIESIRWSWRMAQRGRGAVCGRALRRCSSSTAAVLIWGVCPHAHSRRGCTSTLLLLLLPTLLHLQLPLLLKVLLLLCCSNKP